MDFKRRRRLVVRQIAKSRAQAMLVSQPMNVEYLTGFKSSNGYVILTPDKTVVLTDGRYETALKLLAKAQGFTAANLAKGLGKEVGRWCRALGVRRIAFEANHLTVATFNGLKKKTRRLAWLPAEPWIANVRMVKDEGELALMRDVAAIADKAFMSLSRGELLGLKEWEAAELLEERMKAFARKRGWPVVPSFGFIVAAGENAAVPHHHPGSTVIHDGTMLKVDWGAKINGYCSDSTRTLFFGKPDGKFKKVYQTVLNAQRAAIKAMGPGVVAREADLAARRVIEKAGYGDAFTHGTGHQIGLQVHEGFGLAKGCKERMKPGMVFTVEPGIFLPGWGGVRIEDMVLITKTGIEVLTSTPK